MPFEEQRFVNNVQRDRQRNWLFGVLALAAIAFACGTTVADPDLWGHTLYGLRAAEQGVLVEPNDPFSYTALGSPWINHEWLTEYQYGWLWKNWGGFGLWAWRTAAASIVLGLGAYCLSRTQTSLGAAILLLVFSAESLSTFFIFIRPQLATFALFAITLFILRQHWDRPASKSIAWLPVIVGLWVNLHGGFLAGLAIMGLFLIAWFVRAVQYADARRPFLHVAAVCVLAGLATLINPYGYTMHWMLWDHLVPEQAVAEWQPLWAARQAVVYYIPFLLLGLSLFGWRKWKWIDAWVLAFVVFAAVRHIRHGALLWTALLILSPTPLSDALDRLFPRIAAFFASRRNTKLQWAAVGATLVALLAIHLPGTVDFCRAGVFPWQIAVESSRTPPGIPLKAITLLQDEGVEGNMVTDYAWGQYVLWHSFPKTRVAYDGRYRTVYPEKLEQQFMAFIKADAADAGRFALLDEFPTEIVLLPSQAPASQQLVERKDWVRILHDDQASLFVKDIPKFRAVIDRYRSHQLRSPEIPKWTLFPGGPSSPSRAHMAEMLQIVNHNRHVNPE